MYTVSGNGPVNSNAPDQSITEMEAGSSTTAEPVPSTSRDNQDHLMDQSVPSTSWGLTPSNSDELEIGLVEEVASSSTVDSDFEHEYQQALRAMEADAVRRGGHHCNQDILIAFSEKRRWQRRERRVRKERHYQHKLKQLRKSAKIPVEDVQHRSREALRAEIEASIRERIILLHPLTSPLRLLTPPQSNSSSEESPAVIVERMPAPIDPSMYSAILVRAKDITGT